MTIQELQDAINKRLEKFDGRKFKDQGAGPEFHRWYAGEIGEELAESGIEIFYPLTWQIAAQISGPGDVKVFAETVAEVKVDTKRDRRYKCGGPGTILSIRVYFREELRELTIEETRVFILKEELDRRLEHLKKERERLAAELDKTADKIAELTALEIV